MSEVAGADLQGVVRARPPNPPTSSTTPKRSTSSACASARSTRATRAPTSAAARATTAAAWWSRRCAAARRRIDAGLNVDDEILAIDDVRVRADGLAARLEQYKPGDKVRCWWRGAIG